jgi:hypothetical protein
MKELAHKIVQGDDGIILNVEKAMKSPQQGDNVTQCLSDKRVKY